MDRALAALERKDQYRRIAMGACALRLQMLALPRPAIIDFAAEREREDKRRFRLRIRRRKARAAQEHAVEVVSRLKAECDAALGPNATEWRQKWGDVCLKLAEGM